MGYSRPSGRPELLIDRDELRRLRARRYVSQHALPDRRPRAGHPGQQHTFLDQLEDGSSRNVQALRMRFASGFRITALPSQPENIHGLKGLVNIDEATSMGGAKVIESATILLIWGAAASLTCRPSRARSIRLTSLPRTCGLAAT